MKKYINNKKKIYTTSLLNNSINKKKYIYHEGFFTKLNTEEIKDKISENIIYKISEKKKEPKWMLNFRLKAYQSWINMKEPHWLKGYYDPLNYNDYIYYSAPDISSCNNCTNNNKDTLNNIHNKSNDNSFFFNKSKYFTKEIEETFNKLKIPITEKQNNIAIDAIFDSVSVATTHQKILSQYGIIFCSFNEALQKHSDLVRLYLGSVVPYNDNFFAALNSALASDGSFIYIPKNIKCPIELSTYFRINSKKIAQFERTIIIADENSSVSYIEGCSAPIQNNHQLHTAVVEVIILKNANVKYSTVQNWFSGNIKEKNGVFNFVTKRAICHGNNSKMSWIQTETGSAITWKYPSIILKGNNSIGEFFSVTLTNKNQQADTGTKMIHLGNNTSSTIISKSIASGYSSNTYRGLVKISSNAQNTRNFTQCDSMLIGSQSSTHAFPYIDVQNNTSIVEHEATISKINEEQKFYFQQRGINDIDAISMIIHGFCKDILSKLPLEFAIEAQKLLTINLDHSIG